MNARELEALVESDGRCADPTRVCAIAALCNLAPASPEDIRAGRALASQLISPDVTSADRLAAVQGITGASLFVYREHGGVSGVLGFFGVREAGVRSLDSGAFDALRFDLALVAAPGEPPAGVYAFGVAAASKAAGSAVIRASAAIQEALYWALPIYTRVATEDGARVLLGSLGFTHVDNDPSLVRRPPRQRALEGFRFELAAA